MQLAQKKEKDDDRPTPDRPDKVGPLVALTQTTLMTAVQTVVETACVIPSGVTVQYDTNASGEPRIQLRASVGSLSLSGNQVITVANVQGLSNNNAAAFIRDAFNSALNRLGGDLYAAAIA